MDFSPHVCPPRPEVRVFLDEARDRPDDDVPRLVLADWLDDHGDDTDRARAEHLRIQCRLARPGQTEPGLAARERQLEARHADDWLGPLADDREWAVEDGAVHLLQCRPETVWSHRPAPRPAAMQSGLLGIVDTLVNPRRTHVRAGD